MLKGSYLFFSVNYMLFNMFKHLSLLKRDTFCEVKKIKYIKPVFKKSVVHQYTSGLGSGKLKDYTYIHNERKHRSL